VNTVVGFIGLEYLYDGKQILRTGLEDHFCGKLLGLPMGCDVCYTNHAEADGYQSTSFHDALYLRETLGLRPAPEFEAWLQALGVMDEHSRLLPPKERALQLAAAVIPGR
jgi:ethanolamine ammonia-lyase large subunit